MSMPYSIDLRSIQARRLLGSAERYCSTLQTLPNGVDVSTDFAITES